MYAWGLRNPYGVMWSPDEVLYATENGFDIRGSRPIANDEEDIYVIKEGAWYGWPDYAMGQPVTDPRFHAEGHDQPQFLMSEHPSVEQPWLNFPKHSAIAKLDFSEAEAFGKGQIFVAFFGHMSPMTGEAPKEHGGHRVGEAGASTPGHRVAASLHRVIDTVSAAVALHDSPRAGGHIDRCTQQISIAATLLAQVPNEPCHLHQQLAESRTLCRRDGRCLEDSPQPLHAQFSY